MLIGLAGSKGAGKSTLAEVLVKKGYRKLAFADPIKDMLITLGLTEEQVRGSEKETTPGILCGKTAREAMQTLGTEWGRKMVGPDIWLNAWEQKARNSFDVVCDDVRFPNEAERIRELGGILIHISRPSVEGKCSHESEIYAGSLKHDYRIENKEHDTEHMIQQLMGIIESVEAQNGAYKG